MAATSEVRDEAQMIAKILAGDSQLFHELIRPYERRVYVMALSFLHNEADAEDATQEAFLKAFRNLSSFRGEARFGTWLVSIALNEARSRIRTGIRSRCNRWMSPRRNRGIRPRYLLRDWKEIPSEALERKEVRLLLQKAITALPLIYREVFELRDIEQLSIHEAAAALDISIAAVKVRLHRARMMLQKKLAPELKQVARQTEVVGVVIECKHVWAHISGYLDATLPPEVLEQVQKHLEHCEICSAILDSTRNILILTADERVFELPLGFSERLHARLEEEIRGLAP